MPPKKGAEANTVTGLFVGLRILAVLGVYVVWAYLGFCVLTVYIADRRNPSMPSACDASLLDPLFYIASVVVTLLFLSGIGESESSGHTLYRPRSLQRPIVLFCCSHDCGRVCGLRLPWATRWERWVGVAVPGVPRGMPASRQPTLVALTCRPTRSDEEVFGRALGAASRRRLPVHRSAAPASGAEEEGAEDAESVPFRGHGR